MRDAGHRRHGSPHEHHARSERAQDGPRTAALRPPERLPDLREERPVRSPGACGTLLPPREPVRGRRAVHIQEGCFPRDRARHGQVHHVPPLRNDVQRSPDSRSAVRREPRLQRRRGARVRHAARRVRLHVLRPVRRRLPDGRARRAGLLLAGHRSHRGSRQGRRRPDRARRPRRARRVLRDGAGHARDRKDGFRPPADGLQLRLRHGLRRRPHDHGRGRGASRPDHAVPVRRQERPAADPHLLLPGLGQVLRAPVPRSS